MKMYNWIFKNGSALEIATELARLTNYPAIRLTEAAAFIASFRPNDIRFAVGNSVWQDGQIQSVETDDPPAGLEVWMSTEFGDHVITIDI